jgi:hypothetical protein
MSAAEHALREALQPILGHIPMGVADDVRTKLDAALAPRRVTPLQLTALEEAHFATAQGLRLTGDLRVALWELLQLLRAEVATA